MGKNPAKQTEKSEGQIVNAEATTAQTDSGQPSQIDLSKPVIQQAIQDGIALIAEGKSKADAARAIYARIKEESKEVIVASFVEGATLTEKGALTYWYNCRRRESKQNQ